MSGDLFSKEEILGGSGLFGRRASRLLLQIEARVAYVNFYRRRVMWRLLTDQPPEEYRFDMIEAVKLIISPDFRPHIMDIERNASDWASLIPNEPGFRAILAHQIGKKYQFTCADVPQIRRMLDLDSDVVQAAYQEQFEKPLSGIYAEKTASDTRPFFARSPEWLDEATLRELDDELEWMSIRRGEYLFRQGEQGDSLYVLVNGRLRVVTESEDENGEIVENTLSELVRGEIVGEMALLGDEERFASVYAIRDSELVRLSKEGLDRLVQRHPAAIMHVTRELVSRLRKQLTRSGIRTQITTIAVVPAGEGAPLTEFSKNLARALEKYGPTLHLNVHEIGKHFSDDSMAQSTVGDSANRAFVWWLSEQEDKHRFIVYEADPVYSPWTRRSLRQADRILLLGVAGSSPDLNMIEEKIFEPGQRQFSAGKELILIQPDPSQQPTGTRHWLEPRAVERHHHICLDGEKYYARLGRFLTGTAVGLVLGGGGAKGFAHIGLLKAMEEANLPIDYIGGTSIGSLIAGAIGRQWDSQQITGRSVDFAENIGRYLDLTIQIMSFVSGRKMNRFLRKTYEDVRVEDLWLNTFYITSNISRAQMEIIRSGLLWEAIRASMSLPTILPPVKDTDGDLLVDGGLYNNVPIDVMQKLSGGLVIANKVSARSDLARDYAYDENTTGWKILWNRLNPAASNIKVPTLVSIIMRAMVLGSLNEEKNDPGMLLLEPPLTRYEIGDFGAIHHIIEIGYTTAREQLAAWKPLAQAGRTD